MNRRGFLGSMFAVALAPGVVLDVVRPGAVTPVLDWSGWSDEIMRQYQRNLTFASLIGGESTPRAVIKPTVKSPGVPSSPPTAGVPRPGVPPGPGLF